MNENRRADTGLDSPIALVVGLAAAAYLVAMIYFLLNGGASPQLVLWSSASIAIAGYGGGILYIVASLVRGY